MINPEEHLKLVYSVVNKKYKYRFDKQDLEQVGMVGLLKASKSYKETSGFTFSTFACKCILNEIRLYLRKEKKIDCLTFTDLESQNLYPEDYGYTKDDYTNLAFEIYTRYIEDPKDKQNMKLLFEGQKVAEIARINKTSESNMSKRISKIREQIPGGNCEDS